MKETDGRLKGDDLAPKCPACRKPMRENQNRVRVSSRDIESPWVHSECFGKALDAVTEGSSKVGAQTQMVTDPTTGELMDEAVMKDAYTDTAISGKILLTDRCKLGEYVRVTVIAQVRQVAQVLDDRGFKSHVQKFIVTSVEDVKRGAI